MVSVRAASLLLALAGAGAACDRAEPPPIYPEGTALAVSGTPIPAAEIEAAERRVRFLYPSRSREFTLQTALESFVLPRAATAAAFAAEREQARREIDALHERIRAAEDTGDAGDAGDADDVGDVGDVGDLEDVGARTVTGTAQALTLVLWATARELDVGAWSEPVETIGGFALVQLVARGGYEVRESGEELEVRIVELRYLPDSFSPEDLNAALAAARLRIVDPAYEKAVPQSLRYLMKGTSTP